MAFLKFFELRTSSLLGLKSIKTFVSWLKAFFRANFADTEKQRFAKVHLCGGSSSHLWLALACGWLSLTGRGIGGCWRLPSFSQLLQSSSSSSSSSPYSTLHTIPPTIQQNVTSSSSSLASPSWASSSLSSMIPYQQPSCLVMQLWMPLFHFVLSPFFIPSPKICVRLQFSSYLIENYLNLYNWCF